MCESVYLFLIAHRYLIYSDTQLIVRFRWSITWVALIYSKKHKNFKSIVRLQIIIRIWNISTKQSQLYICCLNFIQNLETLSTHRWLIWVQISNLHIEHMNSGPGLRTFSGSGATINKILIGNMKLIAHD